MPGAGRSFGRRGPLAISVLKELGDDLPKMALSERNDLAQALLFDRPHEHACALAFRARTRVTTTRTPASTTVTPAPAELWDIPGRNINRNNEHEPLR
jgi:hypothetical protein